MNDFNMKTEERLAWACFVGLFMIISIVSLARLAEFEHAPKPADPTPLTSRLDALEAPSEQTGTHACPLCFCTDGHNDGCRNEPRIWLCTFCEAPIPLDRVNEHCNTVHGGTQGDERRCPSCGGTGLRSAPSLTMGKCRKCGGTGLAPRPSDPDPAKESKP